MDWMLWITLVLSIFLLIHVGESNALHCFGQNCIAGNQYCHISIKGQSGSCFTRNDNGNYEEHEKCIGAHHSSSDCFCHDQPCIDAMVQSFGTSAPAPTGHIEAIPCDGSTCYTPQSCSVTFFNGLPYTAKCSNTVGTSCIPFPTNGVCECDSAFCMSLIDTFGTLGITTAEPTTVQAPVSCNECGDLVKRTPCPLSDIYRDVPVICPLDKSFCMTDVYEDSLGDKDIYKRCVDNNTCQTKWIGESAKHDYCINYGLSTNSSKSECHFCCSGSNCNTHIVPPKSTLVPIPTV